MNVLASGTRFLGTLILMALAYGCGKADLVQPDSDLQPAYSLEPVETALQARPFHGNTVGMVANQIFPAPAGRCPAQLPMLFVYKGEGRATHLGNFQVEGSECVFMDPGNPATMASGAGWFTWTAANGDELHVAYDATTLVLLPGSPWVSWSTPVYATGGTGRFVHAQLTDVVWKGGANIMTLETYSSFDGWIAYNASDRSGID